MIVNDMTNAKMSHPKDTTRIIYDKLYLLGFELKASLILH